MVNRLLVIRYREHRDHLISIVGDNSALREIGYNVGKGGGHLLMLRDHGRKLWRRY